MALSASTLGREEAQGLQELNEFTAQRKTRRNYLRCLVTKHLSQIHFACMVTA